MAQPSTTTFESVWTSDNSTNFRENISVPGGCVVLTISTISILWANPDDLISLHVERAFDTLVVCLLYVLFLISVPANIINMIAFYKQGIKERINFCLFFQSLGDLLYMLFNFILYSDRIYLEIAKGLRRGTVSEFMIGHRLIGLYGLARCSYFVTVVIAAERCMCVVSPFRSQRVFRLRTAVLTITTVSLFLVGVKFVHLAGLGLVCVFNPVTKTTSTEFSLSDFYFQNRELLEVLGLVYDLILPLIFVVVVTVCTVVTVVVLRKMSTWRGTTSSAGLSTREIALTRMLVSTSILYIVCNSPLIVSRITTLLVPDFSRTGRYRNTFDFVTDATELLSYINSSLNFFLYYTMG